MVHAAECLVRGFSCEAERCSADMRERSCVCAASEADDSAVVSLEHRQGWAHMEEGGVGGGSVLQGA